MADRPSTASVEQSPHEKTASAQWVRIAFAVAITIASLSGLMVGAVHGTRSSTALSTDNQQASWALDNEYWTCLDIQAHSLVRPGQRVCMDTTNLGVLVTLVRVFGPWATLVSSSGQSQIEVTVEASNSGCMGSLIVGLFKRPNGTGTFLRKGSGASIPGNPLDLPATPL